MAGNLSYGSKGADVKKLQKTLYDKGYDIAVDGSYGASTQAAVKEYQRRAGLSANGVADSATLARLGVSFTERPEYTKSAELLSAEKKLSDWENSKPAEYSSGYSGKINELLGNVVNRKRFTYNMNADPLYRQYRDQYVKNGRKAMMDTVGQASALTGGYANSYAATAGSEAYDEYLSGLNDVALKLYDRALQAYKDEGEGFIEDIELLRELDGDDYKKYLESLKSYYDDGDYLFKKISAMTDDEYKAFVTELNSWEDDRDYNLKVDTDRLNREQDERDYKYKVESDRLKREQEQREFEFQKAKAEREAAFKQSEALREQQNKDREYSLALAKLNASSSSSGSSSSKSSSSKSSSTKSTGSTEQSPPTSYTEFCLRTGYSGIMTENEFSRNQTARSKYGVYSKYLSAMYKKYAK